MEAGCGDAEALLRTPKPVKSIYYDFKYYFDEYPIKTDPIKIAIK